MNPKIKRLIDALDTPGDNEAEKVIQKLVAIGPDALPHLVDSATDPSRPRIQKWSLQALGAIGNKNGAGPLLNALGDKRMTVKLHAVRGLARMKYHPAEEKLVVLLKDSSGGIRVNTIDALVEIKARNVDDDLIRCLSDSSWYVRQHASTACGQLKILKSKTKLKKLSMQDPKKAVRDAAKSAIELL